ncbi:hypothetical protein CASFOL_029130 [Castilleja foliolosa]|uniref:Uncharacterized protein n=1 Tax=Castilleja foliolosa TaxID=1961234 RepID=A0ABD3CGF1_9LAMI
MSTESTNNPAEEDGNRRESERPMKASELKSETVNNTTFESLLAGEGIRSLSLTETCPSPYNPEEDNLEGVVMNNDEGPPGRKIAPKDMSETEVINNNRKEEEDDDGNRRKSEMESILHGQVFPPIWSWKPLPPYNPEEDNLEGVVQNNDEDPPGLEDFIKDIPLDFSAGYVSDDTDDESVFESDDPGPCLICHGPHSRLCCPGLDACPIDLKVEEPYEVICLCGWYLNNGKCARECGHNFGRVIDKAEEFKYFW